MAKIRALLVGLVLASVGHAHAESELVADSRERFTLHPPRLVNRQLFEQLREPEQSHRLAKGELPFAWAVDGFVASVQTPSGDQGRYHAFFVFDGFAALRSPYGLDFDLNLTLFNPSSSDGVRVSAEALPTGTLHFHEQFDVGLSKPLRIDVMGTDLDLVTLGRGLLLEQWPLEGAFGNLAYGDFYLRHYFGGRVFWPNDDLFTLQAGALGGKLEAMLLGWTFRGGPETSLYADVSAWLPLIPERLRVGAEYAVNLRETPRHGGLLRTDYLDQTDWARWHLGYQLRYYGRGFGPLRKASAPTTNFNLPFRQVQPFTNPFEFFGVSEWYEQWSHTALAELELPLPWGFEAFGEAEAVVGYGRDDTGTLQYSASPRGHALPGRWLEVFYSSGLRHYPWHEYPHRLSCVLTNKQVESGWKASDPTDQRFRTKGYYVSFQLEASL